MAWTTPRTWAVNETVTASNMNTHVRDNLNALYGTTTSYTPTVSQGASTDIAKTVNEARYIQNGRVVDVWFTLSMTAAGTTNNEIYLTLPVTASGHTSAIIPVIGEGFYYDASAGSPYYVGSWRLRTTTTISITAHASTNSVGVSPNIAVASGDVISGHVRYVVA